MPFEFDRYRLNDLTILIHHEYGYTTLEMHEDADYIFAAPAVVDENGVFTQDDSPATQIYRLDLGEAEAHLAELATLPDWDGPCQYRRASDADD